MRINADPRYFEGYEETDYAKKRKYKNQLQVEIRDYPDWLTIEDLYHYAPFGLKDQIGAALETNELHSYFRNGEKMVQKESFIYWCVENSSQAYQVDPVY